MATRFKGRDFITIRSELVDFFKSKFPSDWNPDNISDPMITIIESLAKVAEQLHFTVDELRRECDIATAQRASSIYSYALREGYNMMLPRGASCNIFLKAKESKSVQFNIRKFDEVKIKKMSLKLYATSQLSKTLYPSDNVKLKLVLGELAENTFTYNDIGYYSTIELRYPYIDPELIELTVTGSKNGAFDGVYEYVPDVMNSDFTGNIYSLTPTFVGGSIVMYIEFPFNYRERFEQGTQFKFKYLKVVDSSINIENVLDFAPYVYTGEDKPEEDLIYDVSSGLSGFRLFEDPESVKYNYKNFIRNYDALLTLKDYERFMKVLTSTRSTVLDKSSEFFSHLYELSERSIYIAVDQPCVQRMDFHKELRARSARSDCIWLFPYGKWPYIIVILANCNLVGTSSVDVSTSIIKDLTTYYGDLSEIRIPETSYIDYICHKADESVLSVKIKILLDPNFGTSTNPWDTYSDVTTNEEAERRFNTLGTHSEDFRDIDVIDYTIGSYTSPTTVPKQVKFTSIESAYKAQRNADKGMQKEASGGGYDSTEFDVPDDEIVIVNSSTHEASVKSEYSDTHFMLPYLSRVVVWTVNSDENIT